MSRRRSVVREDKDWERVVLVWSPACSKRKRQTGGLSVAEVAYPYCSVVVRG